jgi:hypothetical protein
MAMVRFKDIVLVNNRLDIQIAHDVQKLALSPLTPEQIENRLLRLAVAKRIPRGAHF